MLTTTLWRKQPGRYFFLATKSRTGKWKDHLIRRATMEADVNKILDEYEDHNIYMCPHGFNSPRRVKPSSVDPLMLYSDLDAADPNTIAIRPTIAIESSPGRYVGFWLTDQPASEELNQRLAYHIGGDISGWDRTQVLRVVDTLNYKYKPPAPVKLLWKNGPTYTIAALEKLLPQMTRTAKETGSSDASAIYKKYEDKLPRWVRKTLMSDKVERGQRSEVLWKLNNSLIESGLTREEAFQLLWASPWNKFRERRDGEAQMRRELEKSVNTHMTSTPKKDQKPDGEPIWNPLPLPMSDVKRENVSWLIPGLLARRELTIVEGDPGLGKSYFVQVISGHLCDGLKLPFIDHTPIKGVVAYFDTENTASTVTKARLEENGFVNLSNYFQGEDPFTIEDEEKWDALLDRLEELKPELVVFDTINTYIGGVDTYRASETQQAMGIFKQIARELNCAVILLRHLTKGGKDKAIYRGQGSVAFSGAARIVATVGVDPDEPEVRVVACTKNNIAKPFRSFRFYIESLPDRGTQKNRSRLVFDGESDLTSDQITAASTTKEEGDKDQTVKWLRDHLTTAGRADVKSTVSAAQKRSMTKSMLSRAASKLGVIKDTDDKGLEWWSLPS